MNELQETLGLLGLGLLLAACGPAATPATAPIRVFAAASRQVADYRMPNVLAVNA